MSRRRRSRAAEFSVSLEFEEEILGEIVTFTATSTSITNSGIGPYEFWGRKCFDAGRDYVEEWKASDLIDADGQRIKGKRAANLLAALYENSDADERICEALSEYLSDRIADEPEYEPDYEEKRP